MSNIIKWSPFFDSFDDFDGVFSDITPTIRRDRKSFMPAIDIYEEANNLVVETELAGIDPDKVNISINDNILAIKGEGEKKSEVEDKNYYRKEIRRESFYRNIPLPTTIDGEKAKAITEDGILKIIIPKKEKVKSKTIKIENKNK